MAIIEQIASFLDMSNENQVLSMVANEAITKENIIPYLDVVKNNISQSVLNQAMIYLQNASATMVCGKKAWENLGRTIKENAVPIVLFFPSFKLKEEPEEFTVDDKVQVVGDTDVTMYKKNAVYMNEYVPVNAFDISCTEGEDIKEKALPNIIDAVMYITGFTHEQVELSERDKLNKGVYDVENRTFYISDDIDITTEHGVKMYNTVMLTLYLDYIYHQHNIKDRYLKGAIKYVIMEHYKLKHNIEASLFAKIGEKDEDEKFEFMMKLHHFTSHIIQDFEGYYLSFNETAFINELLDTKDHSLLYRTFDKHIITIDDEFLKEDLKDLKNKLIKTEEGYLDELYELRSKQQVFTYPPQPIRFDNKDFLQDARNELNNAIKSDATDVHGEQDLDP